MEFKELKNLKELNIEYSKLNIYLLSDCETMIIKSTAKSMFLMEIKY